MLRNAAQRAVSGAGRVARRNFGSGAAEEFAPVTYDVRAPENEAGASFITVLASACAAFGVGYGVFYIVSERKTFGGTKYEDMPTWTKEYIEATEKYKWAIPCEAGDPRPVNPFKHPERFDPMARKKMADWYNSREE